MITPNNEDLRKQLAFLTEGLFVADGKIYRNVDMEGRGSDFHELVAKNEHDPKYAVQMAAWRLLVQLMPLCKTGQPHRMREVPAHVACVDCGKRA